MPSVDINAPNQTGAGKEGFGTGLPTPLLLVIVGGGIGLVVFLMKRTGSNTDTGADKNTLLPNTAIMLGSLQQGVLQLQGDVTQGNADLSSQMTGVGENLGTQIDLQSGQIQQSFSDLNTFLSGNFQTLAGSESALSQAIAGLGTQNADLAQSLTIILGNLQGISTGITNTQNQIAGSQASITSGLQSLGQSVTGVSGQVSSNQQGLVSILAGLQAILNKQNTPPTIVNNVANVSPGTFINTDHSGIGVVMANGRIHGFASMQDFTAWPGGAAAAVAVKSLAKMPDAVFQSLLEY